MKGKALLMIGAALLGGVWYAQDRSIGKLVVVHAQGETIEVSEASYGLNRGNNQAGNATQYVKQECDGKKSCSFPVSKAASQIGDHFPGQTKDFDVTYVCGNRQKSTHLDGEAVGKSAFLTCAN